MRVLSERAHGYLDYATIVYLAFAPTIFGFSGTPAAVFYVLAMVHLTLTLSTSYALGLVRVIRFSWHGALEAVVVPLLGAMPWIAGYADNDPARNVSMATAIGIATVALLTDYQHVRSTVWERALAEEPDTENPSNDRLPPRASRPSFG
jgi:hypothetical protein